MTIRPLKSVANYRDGEETATQQGEQANEPVIIKKYANRRLYNTETSAYVTLDALAEMVRSERDFVVYDAKTGEDLTHSVLTQIIVEQESSGGQNLLPIGFLRQLIRFYGNSMEGLVPSYLEFSLDTLTREQEKYQKQFTNAFGHATFEAIQEQARRNIALFEHALTMFSPFAAAAEGRKPAPGAADSGEKPKRASEPAPQAAASRSDEMAQLRQQLAAMQEQINKLSSRSE
jgi:polyhydroxyalkanoate synthesis repressor PhaR